MLSRWEETVIETRDAHDRFPAHASVAYKHGFLDRPIVDEYALILRVWIRYLLPSRKLENENPHLLLTHDIDFIQKYKNPLKLATTIYTQIKNKVKMHEMLSSIKTFSQEIRQPGTSIFLKGISRLTDISIENELRSVFFFQVADPSKNDSGYPISNPQLQQEIEKIKKSGFEIGLHPSYNSYDHFEKLAFEKKVLEEVIDQEVKYVRQHYLRFKVPKTWQIQSKVGFGTDFSLGYPEMEGFRCGTCHPFHPFDLENKRELKILEIPLIAMDRTLMNYRKLTPEQAFLRLLAMYDVCRSINGTFTLLWHNSSLFDENKVWGNTYKRFIDEIVNY
jgi:hypothetical protein